MKSKWSLLISLVAVCIGLWSCSSMPNLGHLGGYLTELKLSISEEKKGTPKFSFSADSSQKAPAISRLEVRQVDDQGLVQQSAWSIQSPAAGSSANTLTDF